MPADAISEVKWPYSPLQPAPCQRKGPTSELFLLPETSTARPRHRRSEPRRSSLLIPKLPGELMMRCSDTLCFSSAASLLDKEIRLSLLSSLPSATLLLSFAVNLDRELLSLLVIISYFISSDSSSMITLCFNSGIKRFSETFLPLKPSLITDFLLPLTLLACRRPLFFIFGCWLI